MEVTGRNCWWIPHRNLGFLFICLQPIYKNDSVVFGAFFSAQQFNIYYIVKLNILNSTTNCNNTHIVYPFVAKEETIQHLFFYCVWVWVDIVQIWCDGWTYRLEFQDLHFDDLMSLGSTCLLLICTNTLLIPVAPKKHRVKCQHFSNEK